MGDRADLRVPRRRHQRFCRRARPRRRSGGGAIHLLNGLYDAKLDHQPVVALVGRQKRISLGAGYRQEIDPPLLFADVSEFVGTCKGARQKMHEFTESVRDRLPGHDRRPRA